MRVMCIELVANRFLRKVIVVCFLFPRWEPYLPKGFGFSMNFVLVNMKSKAKFY